MKQIGQILKQAREKQKLSIDEINQKTHIPVKFLIALEEGNMSVFPAEVYFTGSLKRYAHFLGVNEGELLGIYRDYKRQQEQEKEAEQAKVKASSPTNYVPAFITVGAVLVVAIAAGIFLSLGPRRQRMQAQPETPAQPPAVSTATAPAVTPSTATAQKAVPAPAPAPKAPAAAPQTPAAPQATAVPQAPAPKPAPAPQKPVAGQLNLSVDATAASWVRVIADDTEVFQGTLLPGDHRVWSAKDRISFVVGYVPGVKASLNGAPIDLNNGRRGDISEQALSWDNVPGGRPQ